MIPDRRRTPPRRLVGVAGVALALLSCLTAAAERLPIRTFTTADGLGSSFVSQILQDASGYVWFATRDGLSRWNGYEFVSVSLADGTGTPAIDSICQVRSGEFFVIANDGALYSYQPSRAGARRDSGTAIPFQRRATRFDGQDVRFTRLYEDREGVLWGGGHGLLVMGVGASATVIPLARPVGAATPVVHALLEDPSGVLWVGTSHGLYRRLPDGAVVHHPLALPGRDSLVTALALDSRGRVWVGLRNRGVLIVDPTRLGGGSIPGGSAVTLSAKGGLPSDHVTCLLAAADGTVWVGTAEGLARFDGRTFVRYTKAHGLCATLIHALTEDGDGNVWIATPTGGMRMLREGFSGFNVDDGLGVDHVVTIGEASPGRIFTIGIDWSVSTFDGYRFRRARLRLPDGASLMWASQAGYRDSAGRWWALTNQGLFRFERDPFDPQRPAPAPIRHYSTRDGLPSPHVFRLYEDRTGRLWVGTRSGDPADDGLARFDARLERATPFGSADGLPPRPSPSAFAEDSRGTLWVGFYYGGVARFQDGRFRYYGPEDGIPPGMVTALLVDDTGRLWIATNTGGLGRIDRPSAERITVRRYTTGEGLATNNVRALTQDRAGRIFAGTVRGVDRVDPVTGQVRHYGHADGLASDFVTVAFCDSKGALWFGTYAGVFRLVADGERREEPPSIVLTGLRVAGERYPVLDLGERRLGPLVLDPDQGDIAVAFLSVSRHQGRDILYQYSLDGSGSSWSKPTGARSVNFARLAPGHYQFAVRAVGSAGAVSRAPATLVFTIRPPLWRRWWVIALACGALGAALLGLHRHRVQRLLEMERLRMSIASDLHDEVATNLSSIATFSALVRSGVDGPAPLLDRITVLATQSVDAIREIIWSIDPKPETVASLLVRLHDTLVTSCKARGIHLVVPTPVDLSGRNLTATERKNLWLLLKEAVSNAARHSGGTEVTVVVAREGRRTRFEVRDNGRGFQPGAESGGLGLATMQNRAKALGGTLAVSATPGQGTTVELVVNLFE